MVNKMKTVTAFTLLFVITSVLVMQPYFALAAEFPGYLKVSTENNYLTAGEENPFHIMLKNTGTKEVYEVKAILTVPAGTPGISVISGSHTLVHKIMEGNTYTITPIIYVDENTPLGTYTLQFQISYNIWNSFSIADSIFTIQLNIVVNNFTEPEVVIEQIVTDSSVTAGIDQTLTYGLKNIGVDNASDLAATVSSNTPFISVLSGSKITKNTLDVDESFNHEFDVRISKNTPIGVYHIASNLYYTDNKGVRKIQIANLAYSVDKISKPRISVEIGLVNPRLIGGLENTVNVSIMNSGDITVDNVEVNLVSNTPYIVVLGNGRLSLDELLEGNTVYNDAVFIVSRNAPVGVYTLTSSVSYDDIDGVPHMETYTQGISVESVSVSSQTSVILKGYETSIDPVHPGDTLDLILNLNVLGERAQDVKSILSVESSLTGISPLSPSQVHLGDIESGEDMNASYSLLISGFVRAGQYPMRVTVSYIDSQGMMKSLSETLTLDVRGIINFRLIDYTSIEIEKGEISELETDLLLIGTESVDFVSIEVVEDDNFGTVVGSYEYIGAVDPDSPIPFNLNFKSKNGVTEGEYKIKLKLQYTDDLNKEYETMLDVPITIVENVSEDVQANTGGFWGWLRRLFGLGP